VGGAEMDALDEAYLEVMFSLLDAPPGGHLHFGWWQDLEPSEATFAEAQDAYAEAVIGALGDVAGRRVLDVGAGVGGIALALAARGADVVALAPLPAHEAALRAVARENVEIHPTRFDAFEGARFDAVLFAESFGFVQRVEGTARVLERCARLLGPGGTVVIADMLSARVVTDLGASTALSLLDARDVTEHVAFTVEVLQRRLDRRLRPYHRALLTALGPALDAELARVHNRALAAVFAGSVVEGEMLRAMPYHLVRMRRT
jgi:2-polyprenyl-3-methyl-5-hydroxy-6-metoxy-1,4-benzoquinol methylase